MLWFFFEMVLFVGDGWGGVGKPPIFSLRRCQKQQIDRQRDSFTSGHFRPGDADLSWLLQWRVGL